MPKLMLAGLALLAVQAAAKTCYNCTVEIPVTSRNGIFDNLSTPKTNFEAAAFAISATQQGVNFTEQALSDYATVSGTYKISTQYCMPNASSSGGGAAPLQILTHGVGFDKT